MTVAAAVLCSACIVPIANADTDDSAKAADAQPITTYTLSLKQAENLIDAATSAARAHHLALGFAVVDPGGHLIAAGRMDGASFASVDFARGKAYASTALGGQSGDTLEQRFKENTAELTNVSGAGYYAPFLLGRGTFPIFIDGHLVGAVGASGAPSELDELVVKAAIESIGAKIER